jgi:hypothetical protein
MDSETGRKMSKQTPRKAWGSGRIAVLARLDTIRSELGQGLPLTVIYDRHKAVIGVGYPSFCKLIERYAGDAKLTPRRSHPREQVPSQPPFPKPTPPVTAGVATSKSLPAAEERTDARHEPVPQRTFRHHGIVQEGEPEQLFGPGFLPKRRG